jgi:hypothetical protein
MPGVLVAVAAATAVMVLRYVAAAAAAAPPTAAVVGVIPTERADDRLSSLSSSPTARLIGTRCTHNNNKKLFDI